MAMDISSIDNSGAGGSGQLGGAWNQVAPGVSVVIEPVVAVADEEESGNGNAGSKRMAWNKQPSNGATELGPVMGAHSWPALSESTRGSSSSIKSSSDSLTGLAVGSSSSSVPQGTRTANSSSQKQVSSNGNPNSTSNHTAPTRQKSMKRNNFHSSSNGRLPPPPALHGPVVEGHPNNPYPIDHMQKSWFVSQSLGVNDHPHPRSSFKHHNGNSHPRGDASHHHNYGGRRDQDRGNQERNSHRNYNVRDAHMQPQRVPRFMRSTPPPPPPPPPSSSPFIPPPPVRAFGSPIAFPEFTSPFYYVAPAPPEVLRGVPFVAPIPHHAVFFPAPDPQLHSRIVTQIDYYFSNENLIKDTYLRQNMDEQGWVPIILIAGFKKVSLLTDNIQLILDAIRSSTVVEVQGDKIRKQNDWMRWIMPSAQFSNPTSPRSQGISGIDMLADHVLSVSLGQKTINHSRSSSGDLSNQSHQCSSVGTDQDSILGVPGSL